MDMERRDGLARQEYRQKQDREKCPHRVSHSLSLTFASPETVRWDVARKDTYSFGKELNSGYFAHRLSCLELIPDSYGKPNMSAIVE